MLGTVGWLCPKCGAVISPSEKMCWRCTPVVTVHGVGTYTGWSGTIMPGSFSSGTIFAAPLKTDAQKLEEAQNALAKAERKVKSYRDWADKIEDFYFQLNKLTETLDDLTNEPSEIEDD